MSTRFLRRKEVRRICGYSDSQIDRLEAQGKFPKRVQLGPRSIAWVESEIDEWCKQRIGERGSETIERLPKMAKRKISLVKNHQS